MNWRFLETGSRPGLENMAIDEALAAEVSHGKPPALRFYSWNPYCISLGKNQSREELDLEQCSAEGIDVVFRPTGGRAILHAEELTYSLAFYDDPLGSLDESYRAIGRALVLALHRLEIPAEMTGHQPDLRTHYAQPYSALCFSSSTKYEIQVHGKKLIGSAQRRYGNVVLQHGSILIGRAHRRLAELLNLPEDEREKMKRMLEEKTIELESIRPVTPALLAKTLREAFEETFAVTFTSGEIPQPAAVAI